MFQLPVNLYYQIVKSALAGASYEAKPISLSGLSYLFQQSKTNDPMTKLPNDLMTS